VVGGVAAELLQLGIVSLSPRRVRSGGNSWSG
jgi:hypothetical protein